MVNKEEKKIEGSQPINYNIIQDDQINLYDLWKVIIKGKKIVVAIFMISLICATIYCYTTPKIYRSETYIKLYLPSGLIALNTFPTAKDLSIRLSKIIKELKTTKELNKVIFNNNNNDVKDVKIEEIIGTAGTMSTDRLKVTIEGKNREALETAPQLAINYIENMNEHKVITSKIMSELNEKIVLVRKADNENDIQLKEIQKRLNKVTVLPVGFDPVAIRQNSINLKMEKYRLEQEIKNYKMILLLEEPFISKDPVNPKNITIITISGIFSLIFGVFTVFTIEYFERMRKKTGHVD